MRFATTLTGCMLLMCGPALAQHRPHDARVSKPDKPRTQTRQKAILTPTEAARIAKVSEATINRLFDKGLLKGFRIPGSRARRIPRKNLYDFLRKHGIAVPGEAPRIQKPDGHISGMPTPIGPDGKPWVCFDCSCDPCMCGLPKPKTTTPAKPPSGKRDGARQRLEGLLGPKRKRPLRDRLRQLREQREQRDAKTPDKPAKPGAKPGVKPDAPVKPDKPGAKPDTPTPDKPGAKPDKPRKTVIDRLKSIRDSLRRGNDDRGSALDRLKAIRDSLRRRARSGRKDGAKAE